MTLGPADITVLHTSAGRYDCSDRTHSTYRIWRELSQGFKKYIVLGRSMGKACTWQDGNIHGELIDSRLQREAEFLFTQFAALRIPSVREAQVIVCQSAPLGGLATIMLASRSKAKVLLEFHGFEYFTDARPGTGVWFLQLLTKLALRRADRIRVLSPRMRDLLSVRYSEHVRCPVRVLPPRVDVQLFEERRAQPRTAGAPLKLVMVGALNSNKGQLRLVQALAQTPFDVALHLIGSGPDQAELMQRARHANGRLTIHVHGRLPQAEIATLLQTMDVFVMYSRTEGTPRAMMEAMAVGLPIVSTDAGLCSDVFVDGEDGFLLGPNPDIEIIGCLQQFIVDPRLAVRMGKRGRTRAVQNYDAAKLFPAYRALIAETANA